MLLVEALIASGYNPATFSFVASITNSNTNSIGMPAGVAAGDVAVFIDSNSGTSAVPAEVIAAGWTKIHSLGVQSRQRHTISYKVLGSGDLASTVTAQTSDNGQRKMVLAWRPNRPLAGIATLATTGSESSAAPTTQTLNTGAAGKPLIACGVYGYGTTGTLTGKSTTPSTGFASANFNVAITVDHAALVTPPANITFAMGDSGEFNSIQAFYLCEA